MEALLILRLNCWCLAEKVHRNPLKTLEIGNLAGKGPTKEPQVVLGGGGAPLEMTGTCMPLVLGSLV